MYLSIDPGIDTGYALWRGYGQLLACGVADPRRNCPEGIRSVIIEKPQVYEARNSKGDPNSLIALAIQVGEYKGFFEERRATVALIRPHDWKGTLPKEVHHARLWEALSPAEQAVVSQAGRGVAKSRLHNMLDAVALGREAFVRKLW